MNWPSGLEMSESPAEFDPSLVDGLVDGLVEGGPAADPAHSYPLEAAVFHPVYDHDTIEAGVLSGQQPGHHRQGYNGGILGRRTVTPPALLTGNLWEITSQQAPSTFMNQIGQLGYQRPDMWNDQTYSSPSSSNEYSPAISQSIGSSISQISPLTAYSHDSTATDNFPTIANRLSFGSGDVSGYEFDFRFDASNYRQGNSLVGRESMILPLHQKKDLLRVLGCKLCEKGSDRVWGTPSEMKAHAREKHEGKVETCLGYKCPWPMGCPVARQSKADILRHADTPHHMPVKDGEMCLYPGCGKVGVTVGEIDLHYMQVHRDPHLKSFSCREPDCTRRDNRGFRRPDHLKAHERLHDSKDGTSSHDESSKRNKTSKSAGSASKKSRKV